jgi:hypothetical protein
LRNLYAGAARRVVLDLSNEVVARVDVETRRLEGVREEDDLAAAAFPRPILGGPEQGSSDAATPPGRDVVVGGVVLQCCPECDRGVAAHRRRVVRALRADGIDEPIAAHHPAA